MRAPCERGLPAHLPCDGVSQRGIGCLRDAHWRTEGIMKADLAHTSIVWLGRYRALRLVARRA